MNGVHRRVLLTAILLVLAAGATRAQINSGANTVNLQWNDPEQVFIQINQGGGFQQFQQQNGSPQPTTGQIGLQVNYNGLVNRATLTVFAYFADPAHALTNGTGHSIPASDISASIQGQQGLSPFTSQSPFSAKRRKRMPITVTAAPLFSIRTQNSTAARRPSADTIGRPIRTSGFSWVAVTSVQ